jgi:DNA-binding transcriptional ArsR family regulator
VLKSSGKTNTSRTRIEFLQTELGMARQTAAKHLDQLAAAGYVEKPQLGRNTDDINTLLVAPFLRIADRGSRSRLEGGLAARSRVEAREAHAFVALEQLRAISTAQPGPALHA